MWPQPAAAEARPFGHRFLDPPTHRWYNQDIDWCICPLISLWFCYLFRGRYHIDYGAYLKVYCALQRGILEQIPQASYFPLSLIGKSLIGILEQKLTKSLIICSKVLNDHKTLQPRRSKAKCFANSTTFKITQRTITFCLIRPFKILLRKTSLNYPTKGWKR